jgi:hypothetical protein
MNMHPLRSTSTFLTLLATSAACILAAAQEPPVPAQPAPPPLPPAAVTAPVKIREQSRAAQRGARAAQIAAENVAVAVAAASPAAPEPPEPPEPPEVFTFSSSDVAEAEFDPFSLATTGRSPAQPLVIANHSTPENLAEWREDLAVMARLLNKAATSVSESSHNTAMGITLSVLGDVNGSTRQQPLYVDGFGAIFTLRVQFPLVEPPKKDEEKAPKDDDASREAWEEARREIYGGRQGRAVMTTTGMGMSWASGREPAPYSAETVERLKKALLETLKHASNIRNLKPEDQIVVAVIGNGGSENSRSVKVAAVGSASSPRARAVTLNRGGGGSNDSTRTSTLTLRVRKSDADAFAKGKLTLDEFTRKAALTSY